jgi:nitrite reductase/ring-hydroxylating ferredoxin subunit
MTTFPVASLEELRGKERHFFKDEKYAFLLVLDNEKWRIYEGRCPHAKAILSYCDIEDGTIECPFHSWKFAIDGGKCVFPEGAPSLREFETFIENEIIYVKF